MTVNFLIALFQGSVDKVKVNLLSWINCQSGYGWKVVGGHIITIGCHGPPSHLCRQRPGPELEQDTEHWPNQEISQASVAIYLISCVSFVRVTHPSLLPTLSSPHSPLCTLHCSKMTSGVTTPKQPAQGRQVRVICSVHCCRNTIYATISVLAQDGSDIQILRN